MLGLQVVGPDGIAERRQVSPEALRAGDETLNHRAQERPRATRRLKEMHPTEVTAGCVPGEIEQHFDDPSASEHFTMVLNVWGREYHSATLVSGTDALP